MDNFLRQTAAARSAAPADGSEAQAPPALSGYRTGRLLGVGSSASVWLVEDQGTGVKCALKVLTASATGAGIDSVAGTERAPELSREIAVLGALSHPHLLGLRGAAPTDRGPAVLMDYAGGGSLLNLVAARGRLSIGECVTVLAPVAQAVAYLHTASVQHGDVSPGNVLFTAEGKPLLADLGVGRLLGEAEVRTHGTAGFADADRGTGRSAGPASDVYSLGAIGWYCLTGNPPGQTKERVPLPLLVPDVPGELLHILEAALDDDPDERPTAGELADAVLHSAPPQPLDLVPAVHPSVLPDLLTRRATVGGAQASRRRSSAALARFRSKRPLSVNGKQSKGLGRKIKPGKAGRRSVRRRLRPPIKWGSAAGSAFAALLVVCGALLAGPKVLESAGIGTGGAAEEPATVRNSVGTREQGASGDAVQRRAVADATSEPEPGSGEELSAEMRQRLADEDPVTALSALVAVRAMVLASGDGTLLPYVNLEESEAMAADRDLVAGLQERGHVFSGLSIRLREAALTDSIAVPADAAAVSATAVVSGFTETDGTGATVREVSQSTPQDLVFVLMKQEEVWKIASVHNQDNV